MSGTPTWGRSRPVALAALTAALVLAGGWLGTTADPAAAAFPGQNGLIAFASPRITGGSHERDGEIFVMNPDGTGVKPLTFNVVNDSQPAWSPDGTRIAVASDRDGTKEHAT